jgi:hypothetical protein
MGLGAGAFGASLVAFSGCAHRTGQGPGRCDVRALGARGDGTSDDTPVFQSALDACAKTGGGTVIVPAGRYLLRPIFVGNKTTLHLDAGAVLLASQRLDDYPREAEGSSGHESSRAGLVTLRDAQDVAITGRGVIEGHGQSFVTTDLTYAGKDHDPKVTRQGADFLKPPPGGFPHGPFRRGDDRPGNLVRVKSCRNVHLEGITIQNSPTWTLHVEKCVDVTMAGLHINSHASDLRVPNDDGIDLSQCRRVRIIGCDIDTGDDCIAIFGSEDVAVSSCTLSSRSTAIRVGYSGGHIRNCTFDNLIIRRSNRGVSVFVRGADSVENISFSNLSIETQHFSGRWWGNAEPIHVSACLWDPKADRPGVIRNVRFSNVDAVGEAGVLVHGAEDSVIEDVVFDRLRVQIKPGPLQEVRGGNFDLRSTRDLAKAIVKHDIPGMHCERVRGLRVRDLAVRWDAGLPSYFTEALAIEKFEDVVVEGFEGSPAHGAGSAIALREGRDATLRFCRANGPAAALVAHRDVASRLRLEGCSAAPALQLVEPAGGIVELVDSRVAG